MIIHNKSVIRFQGLAATKFFLRAFNLEEAIGKAVSMFKSAPKGHDRISCPIISEYRVDEKLTFVYVIHITVDPIGVIDGLGFVYYADAENLTEAIKYRDEFANALIKVVMESGKAEGMTIMEPGKEEGRTI